MGAFYDVVIDLNADTSYARVIALTGRGKRVLELGCATGYVSKVLTERFDCTVTGIEVNSAAAAQARLHCHRVICHDAETLDYATALGRERFDVILLADVLEHLKNPGAVLRKISEFLEPEGYLVASIPNVEHAAVALELLAGRFAYRRVGLLDDAHLRFFSLRAIRELFESTGYVIAEIGRIKAEPASTEFRTDLAAFPPEVVEFVLRHDEATTYQFIVKAYPATEAGSLAALREEAERVEALRHSEGRQLSQDLKATQAALAQLEVETADLRQRLETTQNLLAQGEGTAADLRRDVRMMREALDRHHAKVALLHHELETSRALLTEREATQERFRTDLAAAHARLKEETSPRGSVARSLAASLSTARRIGAHRVLYWLLTLQLPARLRDLLVIETSGLFDKDWYRARYADVREDDIPPVVHYLSHGATAGYDPNPFFDTSWYLAQYPDVARARLNPLVHYVRWGAAEGRRPHPRPGASATLRRHAAGAAGGRHPLARLLLRGDAIDRDADRNPEPLPVAGHSARVPAVAPGDGAIPSWQDDDTDLFDVAQQLVADRHQRLAALTVAPVETIDLSSADLWGHARNLEFPHFDAVEVSIVIWTHDHLRGALECLTSILRSSADVRYEVIVVDGSSTDATRQVLPLVRGIVYLASSERAGAPSAWNRGARRARGAYLLFLHGTTQVRPGWLRALIDTFGRHDGIGAAGPKVLRPDGRLEEAGALIDHDGSTRRLGLGDDPARPRYNYEREIDSCSGLCQMLALATFTHLGGFNEDLPADECGEVDLCLRLRAQGLRIYYNPAAVIVHRPRTSAETPDSMETRHRRRIARRWRETIGAVNQVRLIAFYLPQYHPIPENDRWWGKGFTDWKNVARATPSFPDHYQPHLPSDLGFYDLRLPQIAEEQAALARRYGLAGFCYHYYWFHGQRLLELPLERMLATGRPDIPFCLCWANENWTRRWDGREHELLIAQEHSAEDDEAMMRDVARYLRQPHYVRIGGRPLFLVYRPTLLPDPSRTAATWREVCRREGVGEIYIAGVESFEGAVDPRPPSAYGFDAAVEFPPHGNQSWIPAPTELLNPRFVGSVADYREVALQYLRRECPDYVLLRSVVPSWDNTARRPNHAVIFHESSPEAFQQWLAAAIEDTRERAAGDERIVFINAWNEWAEGAHLEPDQRFGHQYLEAVHRAGRRPLPAERDERDGAPDGDPSEIDLRRLSTIGDDQWLWLHRERAHLASIARALPSLPSAHFQDRFAGVSGATALGSGHADYVLLKELHARYQSAPLSEATILDFGCGWGRIIRFFLKDLPAEQLWGADSSAEAIATCRETIRGIQFALIDPEPPTGLPYGRFSFVYLFSVLSHLPEAYHLRVVAEAARLLAPGGLLVATTWGRDFFDRAQDLRGSSDRRAPVFPDVDAARADFDAGRYCHWPAGGTGHWSHLGDTCIPEAYVRKTWAEYLNVLCYIEDRSTRTQNVIVCRAR
jgi:GT2 family glycosyltransferase/2-polyprenyl-3-methyl-5-hydroxy-6-metoxy-1,4-benzoquinol methylase